LIKIEIEFKETEDGAMAISAESSADNVTLKEHIEYVKVEKQIIAMVQDIANNAKHSIYAENESARKLRNALEKKEKGDS
jgi:hypothetical protein